MTLITNYIKGHLMIHFENFVDDVEVCLSKANDGKPVFNNSYAGHIDFINQKIELKYGNYVLKIKTKREEITKSLIIK